MLSVFFEISQILAALLLYMYAEECACKPSATTYTLPFLLLLGRPCLPNFSSFFLQTAPPPPYFLIFTPLIFSLLPLCMLLKSKKGEREKEGERKTILGKGSNLGKQVG